MIVCNVCGTHNADNVAFCTQCGAFLEWEGTRLEPEAPPLPDPEPQEEVEAEGDPRRGLVQRVRGAVWHDPDGRPMPPQGSVRGAEAGAGVMADGGVTADGVAGANGFPGPPDGGGVAAGQYPPQLETAALAGGMGLLPAEGPPLGRTAWPAPPTADSLLAVPADPAFSEPPTLPGGVPAIDPATAPPGAPGAPTPTGHTGAGAPPAVPGAVVPGRVPPPLRGVASSLAVPTVAGRAPGPGEEAAGTEPPGPLGAPSGPQPAAQQPSAVKPAMLAERPRPTPVVREEDPVAQPGDVICRRCGFPNRPERRYCRRCGLDLEVVVAVSLRWWQRWWQALKGWWRRFVAWLHRNRNEYPDEPEEPGESDESGEEAAGAEAGGAKNGAARLKKGKGSLTKAKGDLKKKQKAFGRSKGPQRRGGPAHGLPRQRAGAPGALGPLLTRVLPALIILGGLAYVASGTVRHWVSHNSSRVGSDIRELIAPHYALQHPLAVTATSSAAEEPAANAFDEVVGSPWETAPDPGEGAGQSITATFPADTSVNQIIFSLGTGVPNTYHSQARMHSVRVTLFNGSGQIIRSKLFTLNDTGNAQNVDIEGKHVARATVAIVTVYPSVDQPGPTGCATDKIEFFKKD